MSVGSSMASVEPAAPGLTVAAVARRLGVAPATLRTWDRRYGLGPTAHAAGAHRRYTASDLARLEQMRRLVLSGVASADAAAMALAGNVSTLPAPVGPGHADDVIDDSTEDLTVDERTGGRHGGGRVVAIPGGAPSVRGLGRAAFALDQHGCETIIAHSIERQGLLVTWDSLLVPVLTAVGDRWARTGAGIEVEHLLSGAVQTVLSAASQVPGPPRNVRPVLLAGTTEETHTLPLWAVAAGLAERGISSRMLGGRTPVIALSEAMKRTGPAAVLLWSQIGNPADVHQLRGLPDLRPQPKILVAGPGWPVQIPRGHRVYDLATALDEVCHSVGV